MSAVRSTGSVAEMILRRELWRRGLRYRLYPRRAAGLPTPGRPDMVFVAARVIVFIDSDFWHGRVLIERGAGALAAQFRAGIRRWWVNKITGNVERDRRHTATLTAGGWRVIRVWESDVHRDVDRIAARIAQAVRHSPKRLALSDVSRRAVTGRRA